MGTPSRIRLLAAVLSLSALSSCRTLDNAAAELTPYGDQLRERVTQWERACKDMKLGPYSDNNPANRGDASCDFLFLKDKHWDPNADEFSRYAHSIKLPPPHDTPQVLYREGMGSSAYLKELCAKEAGEWIFRTVSNVDGVLQARPRTPNLRGASPLMPFASEPLVSGSAGDGLWQAMATPNPFNFAYFEFPEFASDGSTRILRFYRNEQQLRDRESVSAMQWRSSSEQLRVPYVVDTKSRATYAFVGRGTLRADFEKHGIRGFELIVIDARSKEVLAFRRTFVGVRPAPLSLGRLHKDVVSSSCRSNVDPYAPKFVVRVLQPMHAN